MRRLDLVYTDANGDLKFIADPTLSPDFSDLTSITLPDKPCGALTNVIGPGVGEAYEGGSSTYDTTGNSGSGWPGTQYNSPFPSISNNRAEGYISLAIRPIGQNEHSGTRNYNGNGGDWHSAEITTLMSGSYGQIGIYYNQTENNVYLLGATGDPAGGWQHSMGTESVPSAANGIDQNNGYVRIASYGSANNNGNGNDNGNDNGNSSASGDPFVTPMIQ